MPEIEELKRVPCRCGGKAFLQMDFSPESFTRGCYKVICGKCNMQTGWKQTGEKAVELWNMVMGDRIAKVNDMSVDNYGKSGFCSNCHELVIGDWKTCPDCGFKLDWNGLEETVQKEA